MKTVAFRSSTYSTSAESTSRRTTGSSPSVGSSSNSSSGRWASARRIMSFPISPLESRLRSRSSASPERCRCCSAHPASQLAWNTAWYSIACATVKC